MIFQKFFAELPFTKFTVCPRCLSRFTSPQALENHRTNIGACSLDRREYKIPIEVSQDPIEFKIFSRLGKWYPAFIAFDEESELLDPKSEKGKQILTGLEKINNISETLRNNITQIHQTRSVRLVMITRPEYTEFVPDDLFQYKIPHEEMGICFSKIRWIRLLERFH